MQINPCRVCGASAAEQIRGSMGPSDYVGQHRDYYLDVAKGDVEGPGIHDGNRHDFRVACTKCDNALGWNFPDAPGYPGAVKMAMIMRWNEENPGAK